MISVETQGWMDTVIQARNNRGRMCQAKGIACTKGGRGEHGACGECLRALYSWSRVRVCVCVWRTARLGVGGVSRD